MKQPLQNLLFLMINPFLMIKLIENPTMIMIWNFICTRVLPLLLRLGNFPKISTTPPPDAMTTTDSIIFDEKPNQKLDDNSDTDSQKHSRSYDFYDNAYLEQLRNKPPRSPAALIRKLAELTIARFYLTIVLRNSLDQHHHRIILDTNPGMIISPPIPHPYYHPTHGIVNVILFEMNR